MQVSRKDGYVVYICCKINRGNKEAFDILNKLVLEMIRVNYPTEHIFDMIDMLTKK